MRYYVAVLHRHGDHLAEHQPLVIEGKAVPGTLDMTAPKYQEHECQHDTAASKEKEQLLPAPETLAAQDRSEEHTSELQSHLNLVCRLLLEKKKINSKTPQQPS